MYTHYIHASKDAKPSFTTFDTLGVDVYPGDGNALYQKAKLADYWFVTAEISRIMGKVLTVIDATITEPRQNKAVKDILRSDFMDEHEFVGDMLLDQDTINKTATEAMESGDIREVSEEEALNLL